MRGVLNLLYVIDYYNFCLATVLKKAKSLTTNWLGKWKLAKLHSSRKSYHLFTNTQVLKNMFSSLSIWGQKVQF